MRNQYSKIAALLLFFASCMQSEKSKDQDRNFQKDGNKVLLEISQMIAADQDIRAFKAYGTTDSVEIEKMYSKFARAGLNLDSFLLVTDTTFLPLQKQDSVQKVIERLQTKHTKRLIEIIKTYGYPTSTRLKDATLKNIDPFIVLHHPDVNFKGELTGLLKDEVSLGRVDSNTFATIMWDLDGRQGIPDVKGVTFVIHKKDGTVDTIKN